MVSLLKSTLNTRALPIGNLRYIRSDAPLMLSEEEVQWLRDNNITTLVDLRSEEELQRKPCLLANAEGFVYHQELRYNIMYIEDLFFRVKKLEVQDLKTDIIEKKDK